jgi:CheY-like chemotaxis protein
MSKRILVVEDQPDNRQIIRDTAAAGADQRVRVDQELTSAAYLIFPLSGYSFPVLPKLFPV